jgi:3-oxoacyl-[acyl-carrier protein] reductase
LSAPDPPGRLTAQGQEDSVRPEAAIITRTALVCGGAQGIGRATAEQFSSAGLQVVITGRQEPALIATAKEISERSAAAGKVEYVVSDMADLDSGETAIRGAERHFGAVDILVINAGGPPPGRILDLDDETWRAAFELLVLGPMRLARLALPAMAERGFGRVIVTTATAIRQPQQDLAISVVLRAAITSAVNLMSRIYAADGVTVNCVAPGATNTGRRRQVLENRSKTTGSTYEELDRADITDIPAGRPGEPGEVAAAIVFLASSAAAYINGTALSVDGGRTETI